MMTALDYIKEKLIKFSVGYSEDRFRLTALFKIDMMFRPNMLELGYTDTVIVAQTSKSGACFCADTQFSLEKSVIGQDTRNLLNVNNHYLQIAALDAAFSEFPLLPDLQFILKGSPAIKASGRTNIVVNEVARIVANRQLAKPCVLTIGTVATMVSELVRRGYRVCCTDLDPVVIGANMSGIIVEDGKQKTLELTAKADIAIATGMTLATQTFDEILHTAIANQTSLVLFAQTGANFAPFLRELGVDTVVSEKFPFYMIPGQSPVEVFRKCS